VDCAAPRSANVCDRCKAVMSAQRQWRAPAPVGDEIRQPASFARANPCQSIARPLLAARGEARCAFAHPYSAKRPPRDGEE
jgi:hypothetical protein